MITLREILKLTWTVTEIHATLRNPDGTLIKTYEIGKGCNEDNATMYMKQDMVRGKLELIDADINEHGRKNKRGQSEIAWGSDFKTIPKFLLDAEVTFFRQSSMQVGSHLFVDLCPVQMKLEVS